MSEAPDINAQISEELAGAQEKASESFSAAPNSFGAGYDMGFVAGMKHAIAILQGGHGEQS